MPCALPLHRVQPPPPALMGPAAQLRARFLASDAWAGAQPLRPGAAQTSLVATNAWMLLMQILEVEFALHPLEASARDVLAAWHLLEESPRWRGAFQLFHFTFTRLSGTTPGAPPPHPPGPLGDPRLGLPEAVTFWRWMARTFGGARAGSASQALARLAGRRCQKMGTKSARRTR